MADRYGCFADLAADETEGVDYAITLLRRPSPAVIVAPHGGWIEPTTSQIAQAVAGDRHSLYCFEGLDPDRRHEDLHITSSRFDEPRGLALVEAAAIVMTVHGCVDGAAVLVGGRDAMLGSRVAERLSGAGFAALTDGHMFPGTDPLNICNRGRSGRGVQLEIPRTLRDRLRGDPRALATFAAALASALPLDLYVNLP